MRRCSSTYYARVRLIEVTWRRYSIGTRENCLSRFDLENCKSVINSIKIKLTKNITSNYDGITKSFLFLNVYNGEYKIEKFRIYIKFERIRKNLGLKLFCNFIVFRLKIPELVIQSCKRKWSYIDCGSRKPFSNTWNILCPRYLKF